MVPSGDGSPLLVGCAGCEIGLCMARLLVTGRRECLGKETQ